MFHLDLIVSDTMIQSVTFVFTNTFYNETVVAIASTFYCKDKRVHICTARVQGG